MKKISFLLIVFAYCLNLNSQTITVRIPDTTVVVGQTIDIPIYVDNSLNGQNVVSYSFQISYDNNLFQFISIVTNNTISQQFGTPFINSSTPGIINFAAAGTNALSGLGTFIYMKFKAINPGYLNLNFTNSNFNYFNEGTPALNLISGHISVNPAPTISVYPNNMIITKWEQLQFSVYGGNSPYTWSTTNNSIATINQAGLLTPLSSGLVKVIAVDSSGISDTTNSFIDIRDVGILIPDTLNQYSGGIIDVPIYISDVSNLNISSGSISLFYNQNQLTPISIIQTSTLLANFSSVASNFTIPGTINISFAGTNTLNGSGVLLYLRLKVNQNIIYPTHSQLIINNAVFEQNIFPKTTNGQIYIYDLPQLEISPSNLPLFVGDSIQLSIIGNHTPPIVWNINDTSLVSINANGIMIPKKSGNLILTANDFIGTNSYQYSYQIFDNFVLLKTDTACSNLSTINYPVRINSFFPTQNINSIQGKINYDTTALTFIEIEKNQSLTQNWQYFTNSINNQINFAASSSTNSIDTGVLFYLKFSINSNFQIGTHAGINLFDFLINEGHPSTYILNENNNIFLQNSDSAHINIFSVIGNQICSGTNVQIFANFVNEGQNPIFQWKLNSNTVGSNSPYFDISNLNNGDIVSCILNSSKKCIINNPTTSNSISFIVNPLPTTPIIHQNGPALISNHNFGNQWYNDLGIIFGATNSTYFPPFDGNYYVIVTDSNNCVSQPSNLINFIVTTNSNYLNEQILIYPNPSSGEFCIIENSNLQYPITLSIFDCQGRLVSIKKLEKDEKINVENLNSGTYLVKINNFEISLQTKLILIK